jgi:hypothetical protein
MNARELGLDEDRLERLQRLSDLVFSAVAD